MEIRRSTEQDFDRIMEIYALARAFMAAHGNPNQWGPTNWPPEDFIRRDITEGKSHVCVHDGRIVGTFFFIQGPDIEPTYRQIKDGAWLSESPYGVVHRLAGDGRACWKSWASSTAAPSSWRKTIIPAWPTKSFEAAADPMKRS